MAHPIITLPRPRPKVSILLAYALCPVMLVISTYGFLQWMQIPLNNNSIERSEVFYLLTLAVMPIVMFIFLSVTAAQRLEYERVSFSYQTRMDSLQKRLNAQEDFLHSMTDYNPESISIFDKTGNYWFINANAAKALDRDVKEIIGKSLVKILGHDQARKVQQRLDLVRKNGKSIDALDQVVEKNGATKFIQTHYQIVDAFGDFSGGVMVREEDVTSFIVERERREAMLRQVINALVAVVDRRDPFASGHSQRVGQLSRVIAEELMLNESEIETAEIAGSLMNFGKVLVSRQILTKTGALSPEELLRVREGIMTSADILSIIDFMGPVVPTLRQVLERVDGTGAPKGLKGDEIMMTARIVAVANAFVAMASPRAHRPSLDFRDALQRITKEADVAFDRRVVAALANCIENRQSKLDWLREPALSA